MSLCCDVDSLGMLSQPYTTTFTGALNNRGTSDRFNIQRTSSVSSLFARRPSTASSVVSPSHQHRILQRPNPLLSTSTTDLDHCWGNASGRHSRDEKNDPMQDLYDFLKVADLQEYYTILSKHLKIRTVSQLKYVTDIELKEMGMSGPELRRLRKHFEKECPQTAMGKLKKKLARSTSARPPPSRSHRASTEPPVEERERESLFSTSSLAGGDGDDAGSIVGYRVIPVCELELTSPLGQGEFGRVYQGCWRPALGGRQLQVAVKVLDLNRFPTKMEDFLKEAAIMNSLDHPDIVRLYGICVAPKCLRLVTELAPLRSLLECLREPDLRNSFPVSTLHNFAIQIARGMAYLEEERLVHRDLAARNVLVFAKDRVKIGDFGLSRALQLGKAYYQSNLSASLRLPVAWCAPEALHDLRFTSASDVWAYGVCVWEAFTYGLVPWAGLSGRQVLAAVDTPLSKRLPQPLACPDALFDAVVRACWNHAPTARPTFAQICEMLPHLSPQAWTAVDDCGCDENDASISVPRTVEDIRSILEAEGTGEAPADINDGNGDADYADDAFAQNNGTPKSLLRVKAGETVYVLSKRDPELWKVVSHNTGQVGYVPPENLRLAPPSGAETTRRSATAASQQKHQHHSAAGGGTLSRMRLRFSRRETNRNSPKNVKKFNRDLISLPQNDFRHVGHVGVDGTMFGDVGFSLDDVDEDEKDASPVDSCLTIGSASDKENPRLSDATIGERVSRASSITFEQSKPISPSCGSLSTTSAASPAPLLLSPPSENHQSPTAPSNAGEGTLSSTSWLTSNGNGTCNVNGAGKKDVNEPSILDMGSSFMEEIFQCLSAKTEGLGLLDDLTSPSTANNNNTTTVVAKSPGPSPDATIKPVAMQDGPVSSTSPPPARCQEVAPVEENHRDNASDSVNGNVGVSGANGNAVKRLSLDVQSNGNHCKRSSSPSAGTSTIGFFRSSRRDSCDGGDSRPSLLANHSSANSNGGGSFLHVTSTLTRAFRKSSASLPRRPVGSQKAPSVLSLEPLHQPPPIRGRLEVGGKGRNQRPVISGPMMISNPVLVSGATSTVSIISSEGGTTTTTTAAVSTPPSSYSPSPPCSNSSASSSLRLCGDGGGGNGVVPSISPAMSNSSLATSSTASSSGGCPRTTRLSSTGFVWRGPSTTSAVGVGGLRALRDRGDLVFRAPAVVGAGGASAAVPATGTVQRRRFGGEFHHQSLRDRNSVATTESNDDYPYGNSARGSVYSTSRGGDGGLSAIDQGLSDTSNVVTPTAQDYTFTVPTKTGVDGSCNSNVDWNAPEAAAEAVTPVEDATTTTNRDSGSTGVAAGLTEELLSFWGSDFASFLGGSGAAAANAT